MRTFVTLFALAFVTSVLCLPASAKPKKKDRAKSPTARVEKKLAAAELAADSQAKAKKVIEENALPLKEAQAKVDAVLTAEQKAAQRQALKDARAAGKKRKEAKSAVAAALKLTPEQKSKLSAAEANLKSANAKLVKELKAALSSDDFAKLGLKGKKKA